MTVHSGLMQGAKILDEAGISAPRLTAEVLLCHAMRCERSYLYGHPEQDLTELQWIHYGHYLHERAGGKPAQYITKQQEFYGRPFYVSPAVLIPRPETEHLVETVLRLAPGARDIVDIGCGSGAIAVTLALELPGACVRASDISPEALGVARRNAVANGASVSFVQCDLCAALRNGSLDVVASNPPYVPESDESVLQKEVRDFEPPVALYGGPTGVEIYARLIPDASRVLRPGGWLVMELGYQGLDPVRAMLGPEWTDLAVISDLAGFPRVLAARSAMR